MNRSIFRNIFFCLIVCSSVLHARVRHCITYDVTTDDLNHNLLVYSYAKWLSYRHQIPLVYKPFPGSSLFVFDEKESKENSIRDRFRDLAYIGLGESIHVDEHKATLYVVRSEFLETDYNVDFQDPGFRKELLKSLALKTPISLKELQPNYINTALQIDHGASLDDASLQFYVDSLLKIEELFPEKIIYCYVFCREENVEELVDKIKSSVLHPNVFIFDYSKNQPLLKAAEWFDFLFMLKFDCLIHSNTRSSIFASQLHDYAIKIAPELKNMESGIDVMCNPSLYQPLASSDFENQDKYHAVTYTLSGGRLGDNLLAYLRAKWIAYHYKIPLLYKSFPYSSGFMFDEIETGYESAKHAFKAECFLGMQEQVNLSHRTPTLYISPYFPEDKYELSIGLDGRGLPWPCFPVNWKDPGFRKQTREAIAPKQQLNTVELMKDHINVAIHVREGGGFDSEHTLRTCTTKIPPLSFYISGVLEIQKLFPEKPIYCHVFTDALEPNKIVRKIKEGIPDDQLIVFGCRDHNNRHDANVLEDFFSLLKFDCLIHPQSNFSIVASLINDYAFTFSPSTFEMRHGVPVINQFNINIDEQLHEKLMNEVQSVSQ